MNAMNAITPIPTEFERLDHQSFLGKAYIFLLGRPIDPVGLRDYLQRLNAGTTHSKVWEELSNSDEGRRFAGRVVDPAEAASRVRDVAQLLALGGDAFLHAAYIKLLGRPIDPTGLRDYKSRLDNGDTKEQVVCDICADPEGLAYAARLSGLEELKLQHRLVKSAGHTASDIVQAGEQAFVSASARIVFGRPATAQETELYRAFLAEGLTRAFVLKRMTEAVPGATLPWPLAAYVRRYESANRKSWRGWYLRAVHGVESDLPAERTLRAIAFRLKADGERTA
jgi:hypothetical protein